MLAILFIIFGGFAIGCAISMVVQRNPLYSAISLIGVFISLACLYVTLSAPFIAVVQVIVYAGAIMVLVIFVIMLLNVEEEPRQNRLRYLVPVAIVLAAILIAQAAFMIFSVQVSPYTRTVANSSIGQTSSIGIGLFTTYLLPFEITSLLLLMAIVGAMSLARRTGAVGTNLGVVPGAQVLPLHLLDQSASGDTSSYIETDSTDEAARVLGIAPGDRPNE